jgi:hypothetical protein
VSSDDELDDGDDPEGEETGRDAKNVVPAPLTVTEEDSGSVDDGGRDLISSGRVDRCPRLEDIGRLLELADGVESGRASGMEPTRLMGEVKYPSDEGVR